VRALDLSDDRLAGVLSALGHDTCWAAFESTLNGQLLRVYDLNPQRVRVDSTTVSGRWEVRRRRACSSLGAAKLTVLICPK